MNKRLAKAGQDINQFMAKHETGIKRAMAVSSAAEGMIARRAGVGALVPLTNPVLAGAAAAVATGIQMKNVMNTVASAAEAREGAKSARLAANAEALRGVVKTIQARKAGKIRKAR